MNTLNLIKKQIEKAAATHDAQINITKYRGVDCKVHEAPEETHGTLLLSWSYLRQVIVGALQITGIVSLGSVAFISLIYSELRLLHVR